MIRSFTPATGWEIDQVPEGTGFSEHLVTLLLGSRKPVLFVEGDGTSLDISLYRACYPDFTVVPRGSCQQVIHAVATMRANAALHRIECAGIVDADDYDSAEASFLSDRGIGVLPVAEIENIFMLPNVLDALLGSMDYVGDEVTTRRDALIAELMNYASDAVRQNSLIVNYCRRRIDRMLKKLDLSASSDVESLNTLYNAEVAAVNIPAIAGFLRHELDQALEVSDPVRLLRWFEYKGMMAISAKTRSTPKPAFEQWLVRTLRSGSSPALMAAIRPYLPQIAPS